MPCQTPLTSHIPSRQVAQLCILERDERVLTWVPALADVIGECDVAALNLLRVLMPEKESMELTHGAACRLCFPRQNGKAGRVDNILGG
jgi:hypothetical protein